MGYHIHSGTESKTERQWNDLGYKLKKDAKGEVMWSNCNFNGTFTYYMPNEVRKMTEKQFEKYKEEQRIKRNEAARECRKERIKWKKFYDRKKEEADQYKTACQFLKMDRVVRPGTKGRRGSDFRVRHNGDDYCFGKSSDYYYYHIDDTDEDPERAKELLEIFPEKYDGHIWW